MSSSTPHVWEGIASSAKELLYLLSRFGLILCSSSYVNHVLSIFGFPFHLTRYPWKLPCLVDTVYSSSISLIYSHHCNNGGGGGIGWICWGAVYPQSAHTSATMVEVEEQARYVRLQYILNLLTPLQQWWRWTWRNRLDMLGCSFRYIWKNWLQKE